MAATSGATTSGATTSGTTASGATTPVGRGSGAAASEAAT